MELNIRIENKWVEDVTSINLFNVGKVLKLLQLFHVKEIGNKLSSISIWITSVPYSNIFWHRFST